MFFGGQELGLGILATVTLLGLVLLGALFYLMNLFMKMISGVEKVVHLEEVELHELDEIHRMLSRQNETEINLPVSNAKKQKPLPKKKTTVKSKGKAVSKKAKKSKQ